MANSTLTSVPSEIDKDKLKKATDEELCKLDEGACHEEVVEAAQRVVSRVQSGEFGLPAAPKSSYDLSFTVGQNEMGSNSADWHVTFSWHW
jgi:hypothetical protein